MRCPACGHENIPGEDQCERCQAALMQEDVPQPDTPVEQSLMTQPIAALNPPPAECVPVGSSVADAIAHMKAVNKGYVCVTERDGTLAGIFTERDIVERVAGQIRNPAEVRVESLMTRGVTALQPSDPIAYGLHLMAIHGFRHVPLLDDAGRPRTLLTFRRVLQYIQDLA